MIIEQHYNFVNNYNNMSNCMETSNNEYFTSCKKMFKREKSRIQWLPFQLYLEFAWMETKEEF